MTNYTLRRIPIFNQLRYTELKVGLAEGRFHYINLPSLVNGLYKSLL